MKTLITKLSKLPTLKTTEKNYLYYDPQILDQTGSIKAASIFHAICYKYANKDKYKEVYSKGRKMLLKSGRIRITIDRLAKEVKCHRTTVIRWLKWFEENIKAFKRYIHGGYGNHCYSYEIIDCDEVVNEYQDELEQNEDKKIFKSRKQDNEKSRIGDISLYNSNNNENNKKKESPSAPFVGAGTLKEEKASSNFLKKIENALPKSVINEILSSITP